MKSDEELKSDWQRLENENLKKACEYLRKCESNVEDYIAEAIAALCNIDVMDMLSDSSVAYLAQPRWLYWYAIRYITNETYEKIALRTTAKSGISFTPNGIGQSINKMASMIANDPMWIKRWTIIKHIIKMRETANLATQETVTFRVIAPKGYKLELKNE